MSSARESDERFVAAMLGAAALKIREMTDDPKEQHTIAKRAAVCLQAAVNEGRAIAADGDQT